MGDLNYKNKLASKLILSSILAFLISALLFLLLQEIAREVINRYCQKPEVISSHYREKTDRLQQYVDRNKLSLSDAGSLRGWTTEEELIEIAVYYNHGLLYHSHTLSPKVFLEQPASKEALSGQNVYPLVFQDGTATVYIWDLFEHRYTDYATYLNLLLFFLCFLTIMIFFIHKKVAYIHSLEQEIRILKGGDLDYEITVKGNDELSSLAREINEMRKGFIVREQYTARVKEASNELMTNISHDLRTPLTALIGYLDILEDDPLPAGQSPFLQKCKSRALQLKVLVNNLFEYFFVSAGSPVQFQFCACTVKEALEDILKEHVYLLEQSGFSVSNSVCLPDASIQADSGMIQRIFDNLFSNARRYAAPSFAIRLESRMDSGDFTLLIENQVSKSAEDTAKTGLGLKNCEQMMLLHHGHLIFEKQENIFRIRLIFPLI